MAIKDYLNIKYTHLGIHKDNELLCLYAQISRDKAHYLYWIYKNIKRRLILHNSGKGAKFTRGRTWKLIYKEVFKSKNKAISREYYIKKNRTLRNKIKNNYI